MPEWSAPVSDSTLVGDGFSFDRTLDNVVLKVQKKYPDTAGYFYRMPDTANQKSAIEIEIYPKLNSYYKNQNLSFDRYTSNEIERSAYYSASYNDSGTGLKLRRMNYDIHVGRILGFPGKSIAFLASIIGTSLPVTGFIIWYNRKFGKKNKKKQ